MPIFHLMKKAPGTALFLVLLFVTVFLPGCGKDEGDLFSSSGGAAETAAFFDVADSRSANGEAEKSSSPAEAEEGLKDDGTAPVDALRETAEEMEAVIVHICGAVAEPGVYELEVGSRVMDAVKAGGGFLPEADQDSCNLAEPVADGCQIYIMTKEESLEAKAAGRTAGIQRAGQAGTGQAGGAFAGGQAEGAGRVNLNTADKAALMTLPGIGESRADDILEWRSKNGRFEKPEDIMKVSGIKEGAFEKIKDKITV